MIKTFTNIDEVNKHFKESIVSYSDNNNAVVAMLLHLAACSPEVFDKPFKILVGDDSITNSKEGLGNIEEFNLKIGDSWECINGCLDTKFIMNGRYEVADFFDNIQYKLDYVDISFRDGTKVFGIIEGKWWPKKMPDRTEYALRVLEEELGVEKLAGVRESINEKRLMSTVNGKSELQKVSAFTF